MIKLLAPFFLFVIQFVASAGDVSPSKEEILMLQKDDIIFGSPDAKHTIIEYSSLSCPHCAEYWKEMPKIKSGILDKREVKYVYREFPLTRSALKGAVVVRCAATDDKGKIDTDEFFRLVQILFMHQDSWAFSNNYENDLEKVLYSSGINKEKVAACMKQDKMGDEIIQKCFTSMKVLNLDRSPIIFCNGEEMNEIGFNAIKAKITK